MLLISFGLPGHPTKFKSSRPFLRHPQRSNTFVRGVKVSPKTFLNIPCCQQYMPKHHHSDINTSTGRPSLLMYQELAARGQTQRKKSKASWIVFIVSVTEIRSGTLSETPCKYRYACVRKHAQERTCGYSNIQLQLTLIRWILQFSEHTADPQEYV